MLLKEVAPFHERIDHNDVIRFIDSWIEAGTHPNFEPLEKAAHIRAEIEKKFQGLHPRVAKRIADYIFKWTTNRKSGEFLPTQDEIKRWVDNALEKPI